MTCRREFGSIDRARNVYQMSSPADFKISDLNRKTLLILQVCITINVLINIEYIQYFIRSGCRLYEEIQQHYQHDN